MAGTLLAAAASMSIEQVIGRSAAFCVHPYAAWSRLNNSGRALLIGAYCSASYAVVLAMLVIL